MAELQSNQSQSSMTSVSEEDEEEESQEHREYMTSQPLSPSHKTNTISLYSGGKQISYNVASSSNKTSNHTNSNRNNSYLLSKV